MRIICSEQNLCFDYGKISDILEKYLQEDHIFLCLGSDRYIFDSLGPFCGDMLKNCAILNAPVIGTMDSPVVTGNIRLRLDGIRYLYPKCKIIVIDAVKSDRLQRGKILLSTDGVYFEHSETKIGDVAILGVTQKETVQNFSERAGIAQIVKMAGDIYGLLYGLYKKSLG